MNLPSRKHPVHHPPIARDGQPVVVLVTVVTKDKHPLLAHPAMHEAIRLAWSQSTAWRVGHYMIMPDHVHFFCVPATAPPSSLVMWIKFWKGRLKKLSGLTDNIWQRDFWDTQMRNYDHYQEKRSYVGMNPVRRDLVTKPDDWVYQGCLHTIIWH